MQQENVLHNFRDICVTPDDMATIDCECGFVCHSVAVTWPYISQKKGRKIIIDPTYGVGCVSEGKHMCP